MYRLDSHGLDWPKEGGEKGFHIDLTMNMDGVFLAVVCRWGMSSSAFKLISQLTSFPQLVGWGDAVDLLYMCLLKGIAAKELALVCLDTPIMVRCLLNEDDVPGQIRCAVMFEGT